jgi:hypothetical protein
LAAEAVAVEVGGPTAVVTFAQRALAVTSVEPGNTPTKHGVAVVLASGVETGPVSGVGVTRMSPLVDRP